MDATKVDRENMRATLPAKALIKGPDNEPERGHFTNYQKKITLSARLHMIFLSMLMIFYYSFFESLYMKQQKDETKAHLYKDNFKKDSA